MKGDCWVCVLDNLKERRAKTKLNEACRNQTSLFNKMNFKNPNYKHSKGVFATNQITGQVIFKSSVGEMGVEFFGQNDIQATKKISNAITREEEINGFTFQHVNDKEFVNVFSPQEIDFSLKPMFQINKNTGQIIKFFPSTSSAASHLRRNENIQGNVQTIVSHIRGFVKGRELSTYDYYWRLACPSTNTSVQEDWDYDLELEP